MFLQKTTTIIFANVTLLWCGLLVGKEAETVRVCGATIINDCQRSNKEARSISFRIFAKTIMFAIGFLGWGEKSKYYCVCVCDY